MVICRYLTELNNVFLVYDYYECLNRFECLLYNADNFISKFIKLLTDKVFVHFERLTHYMKDNFIPRTSNIVEQYYSKTDSKEIKRKYKTTQGILEN